MTLDTTYINAMLKTLDEINKDLGGDLKDLSTETIIQRIIDEEFHDVFNGGWGYDFPFKKDNNQTILLISLWKCKK